MIVSHRSQGFSLVEVLLYVGLFSVSALFLVAILLAIAKVQTRQVAVNEVNQQLTFAASTIRNLIQESSLVEIPSGTATTTLTLRMASSSRDSTKIYSSGTALYLEEGTSTPFTLTDSNIRLDDFWVTKFENPGGFSVVQVDIAATYNSSTTVSALTRSLRTSIARVTAATFDSNLLPNTNNSYDLGNSSNYWKDVYIQGNVGVAVAPVSGFKIKSAGNVGFSSSSYGVILMATNGTSCFRLGVSNSGGITTSTATCP